MDLRTQIRLTADRTNPLLRLRPRRQLAVRWGMGVAAAVAYAVLHHQSGSQALPLAAFLSLLVAPACAVAAIATLGRRVTPDLVEELSLTRLTPAEVVAGLTTPMGRAYGYCFLAWFLGMGCSIAVLPFMAGMEVVFALIAAALAAIWLMVWAIFLQHWLASPGSGIGWLVPGGLNACWYLALTGVCGSFSATMGYTLGYSWENRQLGMLAGVVGILALPFARWLRTVSLAEVTLYRHLDPQRFARARWTTFESQHFMHWLLRIPWSAPAPSRQFLFAAAKAIVLVVLAVAAGTLFVTFRPVPSHVVDYYPIPKPWDLFQISLWRSWVVVGVAIILPALQARELAKQPGRAGFVPGMLVAGLISHLKPTIATLTTLLLVENAVWISLSGRDALWQVFWFWALCCGASIAVYASLLPERARRWCSWAWLAVGVATVAIVTVAAKVVAATAFPELAWYGMGWIWGLGALFLFLTGLELPGLQRYHCECTANGEGNG